MAIRQLPSPRWTVPGNSGAVAAGYYVYTYQPGTSTPKATYTDYTGNTANPNPIVLDARGEWEIWWDGQYKVLVYSGDKDVDGVLVWSQDNYGEGDEGVLDGNYNLARNGSFEIDLNGDGVPDSWTVTEYTDSGGVTLDSTEQYHGLYALKFLSVGSGGGFATCDYFEVQGSLTYAVNFAILSSVADIHNVVEVVWYTAAKAVISTTSVYDDAATNPTSWTYKQLEATAPATARFARVRVTGAKDDDATSGTCWFDNVSVVDIDSLYGFRFPNLGGDVTATAAELNVTDGLTASTAELNTLDGITATVTELNYTDGVTSSIQAQLNAKQDEASAVTGYSKGETIQIETDYGSVDTEASDLEISSIIGSSWETVGPTGSGATNIWASLDDVPAAAKAVILNCQYSATTSATTTGLYTAEGVVYCAEGDVASPTAHKVISYFRIQGTAGAVSDDDSASGIAEVFVPVNSSGVFKLSYATTASNCSITGDEIRLKVVGWVE